jgi:hypothetical protein
MIWLTDGIDICGTGGPGWTENSLSRRCGRLIALIRVIFVIIIAFLVLVLLLLLVLVLILIFAWGSHCGSMWESDAMLTQKQFFNNVDP